MANGHTPASDAARARATQKKLARFLDAFARIGSVKKACKAIGISSSTPYAARRTDPAFARQWDAIVEAQIDEVEASLYQQAIGIAVPVMHNGEVVGTRVVASDRAGIFMLRARRPEIYGDPPYPHARGCTVAGYRRAGQRGAIVERDAPTSVRVVAEPEAAQAAIEAIQRAMLEGRVDPAPPPMPAQVHVVADNAQHVAPVAPDVEVLPPAPRPRVLVQVRRETAHGRVGFGWGTPPRDED